MFSTAASNSRIASSNRPVRARSWPRSLCPSENAGRAATARRYAFSASSSRPNPRSSTMPRPRWASAKPSSIESAASNSRSASGYRPERSASAPRSWWISAERRSFEDGPCAQASAAAAASAARRESVFFLVIRGLERCEEPCDPGRVRRGGLAGDDARSLARRARLREERDPLQRLVLHLRREIPEVQIVEHEAHRLEEVEPL